MEDDTYRELVYQRPSPTSLWQIADASGVVRIGSFSKTVAPGLRLGWINADPDIVRRLMSLGYINSGGGVNHATAFAMATSGIAARTVSTSRGCARHTNSGATRWYAPWQRSRQG